MISHLKVIPIFGGGEARMVMFRGVGWFVCAPIKTSWRTFRKRLPTVETNKPLTGERYIAVKEDDVDARFS